MHISSLDVYDDDDTMACIHHCAVPRTFIWMGCYIRMFLLPLRYVLPVYPGRVGSALWGHTLHIAVRTSCSQTNHFVEQHHMIRVEVVNDTCVKTGQ